MPRHQLCHRASSPRSAPHAAAGSTNTSGSRCATDNATVSFAGATLSGVISPDVVSIDSSVYAAHFDNNVYYGGLTYNAHPMSRAAAEATRPA